MEKTKFINLTPHAITVRTDDEVFEFPPSGQQARVATLATDAGKVDGVPVIRQTYGEITGLPEPQEGVAYIVSAVVLAALKAAGGRADVYAPDTSPQGAIRDGAGRIVAVRHLVQALD